jgi:hypothetical protein
MVKTLFLSVVLLCGCSAPRQECRLELIRRAHPELSECLSNYPSLTMDFMQTIAVLENKAGGYR